MQRVIGAVLIITATSGAGYLYGADLKRYLDKMLYLRYIVGLIRGEMAYTGAPLSVIFRSFGGRVREPCASWLKNVASEIDQREESAFARIWNRGIDRWLKDLNLKSTHSIFLKELGTFLGQSDRDTLDRSLTMYLNRMDLEIEKLREGLATKRKISRCLGVMSGIFLVVVLL